MGAVRINIHNVNLENLADYTDHRKLKKLLKNYDNLRQLAELGDGVAMVIWVDLKTAIFHPNLLTERQRNYLVDYYLKRYTLVEVAEEYGVRHETVHESLTTSVRKIQTALNWGNVYRRP